MDLEPHTIAASVPMGRAPSWFTSHFREVPGFDIRLAEIIKGMDTASVSASGRLMLERTRTVVGALYPTAARVAQMAACRAVDQQRDEEKGKNEDDVASTTGSEEKEEGRDEAYTDSDDEEAT